MNETLKKVLLCVGEVISGTSVWCLLDYFSGDSIDIIDNLISVGVIVLLCNITDYISKKFKSKKKK